MTKKEKNLQSSGFANLQASKKAFTLAEVLITLGIIGVVAAMTIPTLVANYQEKSWNTSAQVFERKLEEALKVMNTQQTLAGYTTTEDFVDELKKHIKIVKTCGNNELDNCFPMDVTWDVIDIESETRVAEPADLSSFKTSANLGKDWNTNLVGVQFANGTSALFAYDPNCKQDPYNNQVTGTSCVALLYDTSGYANPNSINKDLHTMGATIKGKCAFKAGSTCYGDPFIPTPYTFDECVQASGGDAENCYYDNDYWASAMDTCNGSTVDVYTLATYLYNTEINNNYVSRISLDYEKAAKLGFNISNNEYIYLWTEDSDDNQMGYYVTFGDDFFHSGTIAERSTSYYYAICPIN